MAGRQERKTAATKEAYRRMLEVQEATPGNKTRREEKICGIGLTASRQFRHRNRKGCGPGAESVDNVERGDSLALGVLSVGDRVADDRLRKSLRTPRVSS